MSKSYLLKIRGGVEVDSQGKKAGKGPLISEEVSATLGVSQDQYLFQPVSKECLTPWDVQSRRIYSAEGTWPALYAGEGGGRGYVINLNKGDVQSKQILDPKGIAPSIYAGESRGGGGEMYVIENHPNDSRVSLDDSGKVQTLTGRMGTGGGNVPLVMFSKVRRAQSKDDFETWKQSEVTNTLNTFDNGDVRATDIVCCDSVINVEMEVAVRKYEVNQKELVALLRSHKGKMSNSDIANALDEGNGARPSHRGDGYLESDKMYTLNTIERHGVCYWDGGQTVGTLTANNAGGSQRMPDKNHFQCIIEQVDSRGGTAYSIGNGQVHDAMSPSKEVCKTLNCMDDPMKVVIAIDRAAFNQGENAKYDFQINGGVQRKPLLQEGQERSATENHRKPLCHRLQIPTATANRPGEICD